MVMPKMVAKLKMPGKKGPDPMLLMDEEETPEEEAAESPEEEVAEEESAESHDLSEVSDDDLVKEMEARGFSVEAPASEE